MNELQVFILKFLKGTLWAVVLSGSFVCHGSNLDIETLQKADSLFDQKEYTESYALYEEIYASSQYSSAMLLKMAFIQEGLNNIPKSLFFLEKYYRLTRDSKVGLKIEELSKKHRLSGYNSAKNLWIIATNNLYGYLLALLTAASFVCCALVVYFNRKKTSTAGAAFGLVLSLVLLFVTHRHHTQNTSGILVSSPIYGMSGPSAGADVIQVIEPGHLVRILGEEDIWLMAEWDNQTIYIKKTSVLVL